MLSAKAYIDSIAYLGETQLIQQIKSWLGTVNPPAPNGIGDDCAVLNPIQKGQHLITTDSISYGHHFDDDIAARDVGAKLIKRNLSDIAAMGGIPGSAVLALLCSPNVSIKWLENFFFGIQDTCKHFSVSLVGGDISTLKETSFSAVLTLNGHALVPKLRTSSQVGDYIYVTGTLGGSILGKHFQFEPRLAEGQWLAKQPQCHAMMDLSDGLGKDLQALLPADTSAHLLLDQIPISSAASELAQTSGLEKLEHAFCDGEDYELLFTVSDDTDKPEFEKNWKQHFPDTQLTCIGNIKPGSAEEPYLDSRTKTVLPWTYGFEHLKT
ncbi:MAG: thiamine-monophosphate kinase [Lentimonas sp.]|jgi:thiamine-monophosphate kinase